MTGILFLISLITRLIFLFHGYPSITHDEADYFINSYLLAKTGSDILNNRFFLTSGILNATSGIPVYLGSILFFFLEKSVIVGRLPYVFFNSFIPVLFYLILNKLAKNRLFAFIGFTVLNFSPWFTYLSSQSAIDAPTALFFYLAGFYILLLNIRNPLKSALALFFFFLSFNSYMGFKTIFLFLTFIAFLAKRIFEQKELNLSRYIKISLISLFVFIVFFTINFFAPSAENFRGRLTDKILPLNTGLITKQVDYLREISIGSKNIRYLLFNKATLTFNLFFEKYIQAFNPYYLFVRGDSHPLYGTNYYGLFYLFDFVFLILGAVYFKKVFKNRLLAVPFILFILFTPVALGIMVDGATLSFRSMPVLLGYVFFISCGIYFIFARFKKFTPALVLTIYLVSFLHFFLTYKTLIRYMSGEQWHINEKTLTDVVYDLKKTTDKKIIVYVNDPKETLLLYLFYKNNKPLQIKKILLSGKFNVDNVYFSDICPEEKLNNTIQIMNSSRCPVNEKIFNPTLFVRPEIPQSSSYLLLN